MVERESKAPTLKDVGRIAGVSYQTVSRVMSGASSVHPETRELVLAAARQLGFRVNRVAGSLRKNRSQMIGLVMADVSNLFFAEVVGGVEAEAALHNYSLLLANSGEEIERERAAVIGLMERRVDGIILAPAEGDHDYLARDLPPHFPLVAINRSVETIPCGAVLSENEEGARAAVEYLVARGHRRLGAVVAMPRLMTSRERLLGFRSALKRAELPVRDDWIAYGGLRAGSARVASLDMLRRDDRPTAIFASSNAIAEGVLLAMNDLGLKRERDVEVIGFDDVPWTRLVNPPMPVIAQDTYEIGRQAVRMLLRRMTMSGAAAEVQRVPTRLLTNSQSSPAAWPVEAL